MAGDGYDLIQQVEGISDFQALKARALELCGATGFHSSSSTSSGVDGKSRLSARKTDARRKLVRERYGKGKRKL